MFGCETSHAACLCPLVSHQVRLAESDRCCHVPDTRIIFLRDNLSQACHAGNRCRVCSAYPEQAAAEVAAQELASRAVPSVGQRAQQGRARMSQVMQAMATNSQTSLGNSPGR